MEKNVNKIVMLINEYEYRGHKIEIFQHPIYLDFEFVIKSIDGKVISASTHPYKNVENAETTAELTINAII
jgi:hypothetical protein